MLIVTIVTSFVSSECEYKWLAFVIVWVLSIHPSIPMDLVEMRAIRNEEFKLNALSTGCIQQCFVSSCCSKWMDGCKMATLAFPWIECDSQPRSEADLYLYTRTLLMRTQYIYIYIYLVCMYLCMNTVQFEVSHRSFLRDMQALDLKTRENSRERQNFYGDCPHHRLHHRPHHFFELNLMAFPLSF